MATTLTIDLSHLDTVQKTAFDVDREFCSEKILCLMWTNYIPDGKIPVLDSHSDVGGYPLYYVDKGNNCLCPACANKQLQNNREEVIRARTANEEPFLVTDDYIEGCDVNYEDTELYCDDCSEKIESAYGED